VDYQTNSGSAVSGQDFLAVAGTLTFTPGVTTQTFAVSLTDDALNEASENFTVTLSNPVNAAIADGTGVGTITDNDPAPTVSVGDVTQAETNAGTPTFAFTVSLSAASGQTVSVTASTSDGTAKTADGDYVANTQLVSFAPGVTSRTFAVSVNGDVTNEADE